MMLGNGTTRKYAFDNRSQLITQIELSGATPLVTMTEGSSLTTYTWTGYGALASEVTGNQNTTYSYSGQDQLIGVTAPTGARSTYSFDGDGLRRTALEGAAQPTTMVWDGSDYLLLAEPTQNRVVLTLEGEIVACGSRDLLTDPLGTLVREISAGAALSSQVNLSPYGSAMRPSGKTDTPFVYVAAYGYYTDNHERDYVRARELMKKLGRWMQTDPLWPPAQPYEYCRSNPSTFLDSTGLKEDFDVDPNCAKWGQPWTGFLFTIRKACRKLVDCYKNPPCKQNLQRCLRSIKCDASLLGCMVEKCDGTHRIDIWCCKRGCCGCDGDVYVTTVKGSLFTDCGIRLCSEFGTLTPQRQVETFLHEISHCCGTDDYGDDSDVPCAAQDIEICLGRVFYPR